MDRGAWQATVHGVTRVGHDLATKPPPFYLISQGPLVSVSELLQARPRGEEISTETYRRNSTQLLHRATVQEG